MCPPLLNDVIKSGCLECRGFESFSQMDLFRHSPHPNCVPRATRICTNCLRARSTPFNTSEHFTCRRFKCNVRMIHSDVFEANRFLTSYPFVAMPKDSLDFVLDFLTAKDFASLLITCRSMERLREKKAMEIAMIVRNQLPIGPIVHEWKSDPKCRRVYAEEHLIRQFMSVPHDAPRWTRLLQ
mmetsp:Transcript_9247/g.19425  ORF Transcript_9247/g.19425 Transcript_9247/m.19425 type:complete len:183 (+) Transcript_9247:624-1172(+)